MGRTTALLRADCAGERVGSLPLVQRLPDQRHGGGADKRLSIGVGQRGLARPDRDGYSGA
jgi:hypothetical protein